MPSHLFKTILKLFVEMRLAVFPRLVSNTWLQAVHPALASQQLEYTREPIPKPRLGPFFDGRP